GVPINPQTCFPSNHLDGLQLLRLLPGHRLLHAVYHAPLPAARPQRRPNRAVDGAATAGDRPAGSAVGRDNRRARRPPAGTARRPGPIGDSGARYRAIVDVRADRGARRAAGHLRVAGCIAAGRIWRHDRRAHRRGLRAAALVGLARVHHGRVRPRPLDAREYLAPVSGGLCRRTGRRLRGDIWPAAAGRPQGEAEDWRRQAAAAPPRDPGSATYHLPDGAQRQRNPQLSQHPYSSAGWRHRTDRPGQRAGGHERDAGAALWRGAGEPARQPAHDHYGHARLHAPPSRLQPRARSELDLAAPAAARPLI
ncbi:MAG: hypothetical protein AVDCRST_MAG26-1976, partial [uncultured Chloroflexia bacterium]